MRRILATFFVLQLLLMNFGNSPALAAVPISSNGELSPNHSGISSAAEAGGVLYTLEGGNLNLIRQAGQGIETLLYIGDYVTIDQSYWDWLELVSDGQHLYLLSPFDGNLYILEQNALRKTVQLDVSHIGRASVDNLRYVIFSSPVIVEDYLYLLSMDPDNMLSSEDIYRFQLEDGRSEKVQINTNGFTAYNTLEPGELLSSAADGLLVLDRNSRELLQVDTENLRVVSSKLKLPENENGMFAMNNRGDIYFLSGMKVMCWNGESLETIDHVPFFGPLEAKEAFIWNGKYTVLSFSTGLFACGDENNHVTATVLTIWDGTGGSSLGDVLSKFMMDFPDISVELVGTKDDDPLEKLTTVNMSKDNSIDIFLLPSYLIDSCEIYRRGFSAPIHSSFLSEDVQEMYPQIRDFLIESGVLYGYPVELWPNYWTVRQDLLAEAGIDAVPVTYGEYLDLMVKWYERGYSAKQEITFDGSRSIEEQQRSAIDTLLVQYIRAFASQERPLSFNTPEFRACMEKINSLSSWKEKYLVTIESPEQIFSSKAISPFYRSLNPRNANESCIIPPAFTDRDAVISANLDYFIICPNSEHKNEAIQFLEFFSKKMDQIVKYTLYENENEPVEQESYQSEVTERMATIESYRNAIINEEQAIAHMVDDKMIASSRAQIKELEMALADEEAALAQEKGRWLYSPDVISEYKSIESYISIKGGDLVWAITETIDAESILMRYLTGAATLEQVLNELDNRVSMMFYEGQF